MNRHVNSLLFSAAIIVAAIVIGNAFMNRNRPVNQVSDYFGQSEPLISE